MAAKETKKGIILYQAGQSIENLHIIAGGKVRAYFPGGELYLGKGDVLGLCDLYHGVHSMSYETVEDTQIGTYPYRQLSDLKALLKIPEITHFFLYSSARQAAALFGAYTETSRQAEALYTSLHTQYEKYKELCQKNNIPVKSFPALEEAPKPSPEGGPDSYLAPYYADFNAVNAVKYAFLSSSALSEGFLMQASKDIRSAVEACQKLDDCLKQYHAVMLNRDFFDLFELFASLQISLKKAEAATEETALCMNAFTGQLKDSPYIDQELLKDRLETFGRNLELAGTEDEQSIEANAADLKDSLGRILSYSGTSKAVGDEFRGLLEEYKNLSDKNSTDDSCRSLRLRITKSFYPIYTAAFKNSLTDDSIPIPVLMFLHFGYMDEELAGMENAMKLYPLAYRLPKKPQGHVYTFYQWLLAIYNGDKEPSRNEFDNDFAAHLRELKSKGQISADEEGRMLKDPMEWVNFELENAFPTVNKITYGRITTFCPVFSAHTVFKSLENAFVTEEAVDNAIQMIRSIDYSAYYRETNFSSPPHNIVREPIQVEILPDVILTPCVGNRGVMWQEIEGKKRNSPARMFLAAFHMEDITDSLVRLTGEYRWEMCRRIQGVRWNDISERSLTSEYCDYAQFYRKNPDLSADAKDKVKTALQKAKNSYKEMFVSDYITWIQFEGNGSPRLNKVARAILFMHCPFSAAIRTKLAANPLYKEMLEAYKVRNAQKVNHLQAVCQRFRSRGDDVPEELEAQRVFLEG